MQTLGKPALALKSSSERSKLAVKQAAGNGNKHQRSIGREFRVGGRSGLCGPSGRYALGRAWFGIFCLSTRSTKSTTSTLLLHPQRHFIRGLAAPRNQACSPKIAALPERQAVLAEKVFVVKAQLFEARARYVRKFQFGLLGSAGGLAAFGYVLHSAAGGLHHLIVSAAALFYVAIAK